MEMSDKFCVIHLKYLNCVSLHNYCREFVRHRVTGIYRFGTMNKFFFKDDENAAKLSKPRT